MTSTDTAWRRWGETDPYFGVLSLPEFRTENLDKNLPAFFKSGHDYVSARLSKVVKLYGNIDTRRALDFGCGVGRLVIPLAEAFQEVVGLDISPAMLAEARANANRAGRSNVTLEQSDETLSAVNGPFDFVHSYIVLQHIPTKRGEQYISRLLGLVAPGGVASIQITIDRGDGPIGALRYWAQRYLPGIQIATNAIKGRKLLEPLVEMNEYSLPRVLTLFEAQGFGEASVDVERQGRVLSVNLMAQRLIAD